TRHKQDNEKDLSRLASFLAVKSLCKTYQDLTDERGEILEAKADIGVKETLLTERQKEEETISGNERQKNLLASQWDDEKKERITKLSAAREKDKEIAKQKQLLKQKQQDLEKADQSYADSLADQEETDLAYAFLLQQEEKNNQWLSLHKEDESLGMFLSGLKERIAFITSEEQELKALSIKRAGQKQETTACGEQLAEAEAIAGQKERELRAIVDEQNNLEREKQDLLKGYTLSKLYAMKTDLEKGKAAYQLVMSMEERREQLQEGKPCPLCGSTTHPYASHLPPPVANDESIAAFEDRIARIEAIQEKQQEGGTTKESAEKAVRTTSQTVQERKATLAVMEEKNKELIRQQTDKRESLSQRKTEATEMLRPYGYEEWEPSALKELTAREKTWKSHSDEKQGIHDALNIKKGKLETARSNVDHARTDGKECASQKAETSKELERLQTERKELLGDLSVDLEEEKIKERDAKMKESQEKAHAAHQKIHDQCEGLKSAIHELTLRLSSLEEDVEKNHSSFLHGLESLNVPDEASFANLLLDEKEEARISAIRKTIDEESAALDALSKEYEREPESPDPERPETEILQALSIAQESKEMIAQRIGAVKTELESDDRQRETQQEKQKEIAKKEKTVQSWKSFNSLIGSSDGKKFRDFAQAITLRRLIRQANEELKRLNDRYLLADDSEKPLDFFVYDTWQGDAKRTVKSLSGGESFIVSLALALGLADMNAKAVKIDSLFLDEGFGTLNPQEAEAIVKALSAIGGNGKMIAIISHVPVLQEYITAKIEAVKNESGKSVLKGTGVSD
ncbi:MAG: SbcC/MukB-like Walker B domain-containing protein, partial [Sphaerochaetaceae bacterium]